MAVNNPWSTAHFRRSVKVCFRENYSKNLNKLKLTCGLKNPLSQKAFGRLPTTSPAADCDVRAILQTKIADSSIPRTYSAIREAQKNV